MTIEQVHAAWSPAHLLNRLAEPEKSLTAFFSSLRKRPRLSPGPTWWWMVDTRFN